VMQPRHRLDFPAEAVEEYLLLSDGGRDELDGYFATGFAVQGAVDGPHPALADAIEDVIVAEDPAGERGHPATRCAPEWSDYKSGRCMIGLNG